jgi:hypothetical protein
MPQVYRVNSASVDALCYPASMKRDESGKFVTPGSERTAKSTIGVRLPEWADAIVRLLPNRAEKLRQWIIEGIEKEGLKK